MSNRLYYGDNFSIMEKMPRDCVDLIYLDPPFNSKRNYNLLYKNMTGRPAPDQDIAFCDTWEMDEEKVELARKMPMLMREQGIEDYYVEFWRLWIQALRHTNEKLLAYMIYMVQRIMQMKVILKPTGSIYLHCDPEASHYIKVMMDAVFGHNNFLNEIIWHYDGPQRPSRKNFGKKHDVILRYSKTDKFFASKKGLFPPTILSDEDLEDYQQHDDGRYYYDLPRGDYTDESIRKLDEEGRIRWTKNGNPRVIYFLNKDRDGNWIREKQIHDVWHDIYSLGHVGGKEKKGYPTQKPIKLLRRIVEVSSRPGDVVFDPFCGCGTTIYAAHELGRKWIGCDIAILAVQLVSNSLYDDYQVTEGKNYEITGIPVTTEQAEVLFKQDPFEFERWLVQYMEGIPTKRTGDKGIDGRIYLLNEKHIVVSVKGGNIRPTDVRDLRGVLEREDDAEMGCFLSLNEPTKAMKQEAASAGMYEYKGQTYPRIQLLTVADVLEKKKEVKSSDKFRMSKNQLSLPY